MTEAAPILDAKLPAARMSPSRFAWWLVIFSDVMLFVALIAGFIVIGTRSQAMFESSAMDVLQLAPHAWLITIVPFVIAILVIATTRNWLPARVGLLVGLLVLVAGTVATAR